MSSIYLIESYDKLVLDDKLNELTKNNKDTEIVYYDLLETPIERLIEDLDTYNFLSNKKIVVGMNASFLSSDRTKKEVEHNLEIFEKYIENPSLDNILILISENIDKRKKITSLLLKNCELVEEIGDITNIIKKKFSDYKISNSTINKLIEYCMNDHEKIFNEIEKLKLYKIEEKEILDTDIDDIVVRTLDDNIYHFIDSILSKDKKYAFLLYNNFILHGKTVIEIINLLAYKIRLLYQVKVLYNNGNGEKTISKMLKVHEYPVKLAKEASYKYNEEDLLRYLYKLSKLDLDIKSGGTTGEVEFETLLAEI